MKKTIAILVLLISLSSCKTKDLDFRINSYVEFGETWVLVKSSNNEVKRKIPLAAPNNGRKRTDPILQIREKFFHNDKSFILFQIDDQIVVDCYGERNKENWENALSVNRESNIESIKFSEKNSLIFLEGKMIGGGQFSINLEVGKIELRPFVDGAPGVLDVSKTLAPELILEISEALKNASDEKSH